MAPSNIACSSSNNMITSINQYHDKLTSLEDVYYVGTPNLSTLAEYNIGSVEGHKLIVKNTDEVPTKFLLCSVFEIDHCDFFFLPDGNFDLMNQLYKKLSKVKATFFAFS